MIAQYDATTALPTPAEHKDPQETLLRNLRSLTEHNPTLVERLCWPVNSSHVKTERDSGETLYRFHAQDIRIDLDQARIASLLAPAQTAEALFIFATGIGELPAAALHAYPDRRITVWENDPWLLRMMLSRYDFSAAIREKRLHILLGIDFLDQLPALKTTFTLAHPALRTVYEQPWQLLQQQKPTQAPFVVVAAGELFVDDVIESLRRLGFTPWMLDFQRLSLEELDFTVKRLNPEFIFSTNYQNGMAEFCHERNLPLLCWEVDPHFDDLRIPAHVAGRVAYFGYNPQSLKRLKTAGLALAEYLPLATNPERRFPVQEENQTMYSVAFVGSSMQQQVAEARERFLSLYARTAPAEEQQRWPAHTLLQAACEEQARHYDRFVIPEFLQQHVPLFFRTNQERGEMNAAMLLGEIMAAEKRIVYLNSLKEYDIHVWGDAGWTSGLIPGIQWHGYAGHQQELNRIYSNTAINIDINRLYQMNIIPMRVFDILACGGFLLTEYSEELAEHFLIGVELEAYKTLDELQEKVAYYLRHPERRREIAQQGYRAVRERHTIIQRIEGMLHSAGLPVPESR